MQRKDAAIEYFLDSIGYERKLERTKLRKKKQLDKYNVDHRHDNSIKRRIMNLYDRACRKFRQNKILWKEYLEYLVRTKSMQKLNRVVSSAVLVHPDVLDFWLIGAYSELDMKGNLLSSRNLMLQALRVNENAPKFYTAYLKFEVRFLDKLMERRAILNGPGGKAAGGKSGELDFIDEDDDDSVADEEVKEKKEEVDGEIKPGEEGNIVKIVVGNLIKKFGKDAQLLREAKAILKQSKHVSPETIELIRDAYKSLKEEDPIGVMK